MDHNPRRITKADKGFANKLDFENIKFPLKIRDIHKIEKNAQKNKIVSKKCSEEKHVDLLLIGEEVKRHYVLIKDFSTFMYDHTLLRWRKRFCRYCLQAFSSEEIMKDK